MNLRALLAVLAVGIFGGVMLGGFAESLRPKPARVVHAQPTLAARAAIALQASYNTKQYMNSVPLRFVGSVVCKETQRISPTAGSMACQGHLVGPRTAGVGGCAEIVGVYYDQLAAFVPRVESIVPCPDGNVP